MATVETTSFPISRFVQQSLDLHIFFLRIMKEHSFFLEIGFFNKDAAFAQRADQFNRAFNQLLTEVVLLADGNLSEPAVRSGEFVTDKTLRAEVKTQELSGIAIDTSLTQEELLLLRSSGSVNTGLANSVRLINERAIALTKELVEFKTLILDEMLKCQLLTFNFPLLIEHIRREALFFISQLERLQLRGFINFSQEIIDQKVFWDRIMAEHAQFIAHLLDPTEVALIGQADNLADLFFKLRQQAESLRNVGFSAVLPLVREEIRATRNIRNFKSTAEELVLTCSIKSIIIPLLADHVLREANHFLRILELSGQSSPLVSSLGVAEQAGVGGLSSDTMGLNQDFE
ncbi:DUF2935 domain-containing protein [Desulfitobacterium sp.]|nr:DUF2935 domain-containing protein [Desulfitobacterium sp.]MEA4902686.1 DUF2935 domain-containing protein [Desulfitobacterium sp.]